MERVFGPRSSYSAHPRQRDVRRRHGTAVMHVLRPISRTLDKRPIPVQLNELAAVDRPEEAGTSEVIEGARSMAPK